MQKLYQELDQPLQEKLEQHPFFVSQWLVSEVAKRYNMPVETIEKICNQFDLPLVGSGKARFICMYKPNVFKHPITGKKALQTNLFELPTLNAAIRRCFMPDYQGNTWFWHRFFWRMPHVVLKGLEYAYMSIASLYYSPRHAMRVFKTQLKTYWASRKIHWPSRVGSCFDEQDVKTLATLIRHYYCSCLWQKGDILIVDNKQVAHAGMPGAGPRIVRALICNPLAMRYSPTESGAIDCTERTTESVGFYMTKGMTL